MFHDWLPGGHGTLTLEQGCTAAGDTCFWHLSKALYDWNPNWVPQVAPLQIARMLAAVGNNGLLSQPQLVLKVAPAGGQSSYQFQPILSTARSRFRGLKIPVAGKTGTAETGQPDLHAWFAGYTFAHQADKPDIAIAVWVQNIGEGADVAAPIFRRSLESYFGLPLTRYP